MAQHLKMLQFVSDNAIQSKPNTIGPYDFLPSPCL